MEISNVGLNKQVKVSNKYNFIILSLIMLDYILTYIGIHHFGCIEEGNMFMVWLFEMPFSIGILIRAAQGLWFYGLIRYVQIKGVKYYKKLMIFSIIVELGVMVAHLGWIIQMMKLFL